MNESAVPISFSSRSRQVLRRIRCFQMYAFKTEIALLNALSWVFSNQKTMYGGKEIGGQIFVFASENEGGVGLVAVGTVIESRAVPRKPGVERQTLRVSISVLRTRNARRRPGRSEPARAVFRTEAMDAGSLSGRHRGAPSASTVRSHRRRT